MSTMANATIRTLQISIFSPTSSNGDFLACFPSLTVRRTSTHKVLKHTLSPSRHPLCCLTAKASVAGADVATEQEVVKGYTMTQLCDKMIDFFMNKKPTTKDWRKILVYRDDWNKYKDNFYNRCQVRIDAENDPSFKQKLVLLARKVKKVDNEIEKHMDLFKEVEENPLDIDAIVAKRRKDFNGEFFKHLNVLADIYNSLDRQDAIIRLGAKCLSAVRVYDCTLENLDSLETAQSKFDEILNSASLEEACSKVTSLAKSKELDSSLILLINSSWAAAKESTSMKNEVKEIMYQIYKATQKSLRSISPPEIRLLKHLLNIADPDERFTALANSFSLVDDAEPSKNPDDLCTTPKELHKWIKIMLDAYHLNKEETDLIAARKLGDPIIIQRLIILKQIIEEDYLSNYIQKEGEEAE
ncbi:Endoribonuclease E-like protein [Rhynchospora pubera]|uniref:Endoribonuclease E-like protein n=1 Tax=Rhynchospora pubera TaxID=906938 RepID=A0AAV8D364_9POAL|nr:Endoribonuclease E-like protein [Rhynchospora pubera]